MLATIPKRAVSVMMKRLIYDMATDHQLLTIGLRLRIGVKKLQKGLHIFKNYENKYSTFYGKFQIPCKKILKVYYPGT